MWQDMDEWNEVYITPTAKVLPVTAPPASAAPTPQGAITSTVNHPAHYTYSSVETIDAIEAWNLGYHLGNAVKYLSRAKHKGKEREDIQKAIWYLQRYLDKVLK